MQYKYYLGGDFWRWGEPRENIITNEEQRYTLLYTVMKLRKKGWPIHRFGSCIEYGPEALIMVESVFGVNCNELSEERIEQVARYISQIIGVNRIIQQM